MPCDRANGVAGHLCFMKLDVYQTNKEGTYLFLPQGAPFSAVPQPVRDSIGFLHFFDSMELAIGATEANHSEIRSDLERQGYSIHQARFEIRVP